MGFSVTHIPVPLQRIDTMLSECTDFSDASTASDTMIKFHWVPQMSIKNLENILGSGVELSAKYTNWLIVAYSIQERSEWLEGCCQWRYCTRASASTHRRPVLWLNPQQTRFYMIYDFTFHLSEWKTMDHISKSIYSSLTHTIFDEIHPVSVPWTFLSDTG